ncbi:hypothetical protein BDN72DRAFT_440305 [Pluteus cervinus]|uniref:Uncharacterized protein n=1 Tax=Pluteus cervinus TaxID=181527 RepID=A0ACD3A7B8_9AGAR|nr:hypothetical protein BDN72DRAFT_440305 [Pluteus cervinus]
MSAMRLSDRSWLSLSGLRGRYPSRRMGRMWTSLSLRLGLNRNVCRSQMRLLLLRCIPRPRLRLRLLLRLKRRRSWLGMLLLQLTRLLWSATTDPTTNLATTIPSPIRMLVREHLRIRVQQSRQATNTPRPRRILQLRLRYLGEHLPLEVGLTNSVLEDTSLSLRLFLKVSIGRSSMNQRRALIVLVSYSVSRHSTTPTG